MDTEDMLCPKRDLEIYLKDILPTTVSLVPLPKKTSPVPTMLQLYTKKDPPIGLPLEGWKKPPDKLLLWGGVEDKEGDIPPRPPLCKVVVRCELMQGFPLYPLFFF